MKRFPRTSVFLSLGLVAFGSLVSGEESRGTRKEKSVVLQDFDESGSGFSFRDGALVKPESSAELYLKIDLVLDLPHGLGANNAQTSPTLSGKGGIIDLGERSLGSVARAPKAGYVPLLKPEAIVKGHTYCVVTADGAHYGKLHVVNFDPEEALLEFTWRFQPRRTNVFD